MLIFQERAALRFLFAFSVNGNAGFFKRTGKYFRLTNARDNGYLAIYDFERSSLIDVRFEWPSLVHLSVQIRLFDQQGDLFIARHVGRWRYRKKYHTGQSILLFCDRALGGSPDSKLYNKIPSPKILIRVDVRRVFFFSHNFLYINLGFEMRINLSYEFPDVRFTSCVF